MAKTSPRTVDFHGKPYEIVASRIDRFWEDHPTTQNWAIRPELLHVDEQSILYKTTIVELVEGIEFIRATGHAEEKRSSSGVNSTSGLENCETSSVGRALAVLGYTGGGEFASADELTNALQKQNYEQPLNSREIKNISDRQIKLIEFKRNELKTQNPKQYKELSDWVTKTFTSKPIKEYTMSEAKKLIDKLLNQEDTQPSLEDYSDEPF